MPKNIKVLLSSQPLSIYDKFYESGFFPLTIGGWNKERIRFYLQKTIYSMEKVLKIRLLMRYLKNQMEMHYILTIWSKRLNR